MLYVVVEELIPEMSQGQHSNVGTVFFAVGFSVMMVLDVALGVTVGALEGEISFKISENGRLSRVNAQKSENNFTRPE